MDPIRTRPPGVQVLWPVFCIGWLVGAAESSPAQTAESLWSVENVQHALGRDPNDVLHADRPGEWPRAWDRLRDVGPAVAPALWQRLGQVRNSTQRLLWIAAYAAAAGSSADQRLMVLAVRDRTPLRERVIALLAMASGPRRAAEIEPLRKLVRESRSPALAVAGLLALSRFEGRSDVADSGLLRARRADPGVLAAALYCGAVVSEGALAGRFDELPSDDGGRLVWRGALLGRGDAVLRDRLAAVALAGAGRAPAALRRAAAVAVARAGDPEAALAGLENGPAPELVVLLASRQLARRTCLERGWLRPLPAAALDDAVRRQLAVWYAVQADAVDIESAAPLWRSDTVVGPVALGLAWRSCARPGELRAGDWLSQLDAAVGAPLLSLGLKTGELSAELPADAGQRIAQAYRLAVEGRLPVRALAGEIELDLWRGGDHPGRALHGCHMELVRDLLLSGSNYAQRRRSTRAFEYLPGDLRRDDRRFYEVAYEFWQWLAASSGRVPADCRLGR